MKKISSVLLSFLLVLGFKVNVSALDSPQVSAQTYVLYCAENRQLVVSKDENSRMKPASTTKLMTVLLTLEQAARHNSEVTFTREMTAEGSSMYLKYGDKLRLRDLAAGMMMASGNDAAQAAAVSISGSCEKFSELMNARARDIGMKNTHFVTPSGLDNDNHYSTAYDLALLMEEGLKNSEFAKLTAAKSSSVAFISPENQRVTYTNHNRLLSMYPDCIGGKTGYTMAAGRCLVSAARRDGLTLICVTLNDRNDWNDHMALYDYGFGRLSRMETHEDDFCMDVPCEGGESESVPVAADREAKVIRDSELTEPIKRKIHMDSALEAPLKEGQTVGSIEYTQGGKTLDSIPLKTVCPVEKKRAKGLFEKIKEWFQHGKK